MRERERERERERDKRWLIIENVWSKNPKKKKKKLWHGNNMAQL